jgi:aldose 1-epimerase
MSIKISTFGDSPAKLYTIVVDGGAKLTLTDLGGAVTGFVIPDRAGKATDVVLGYDSYEDYMNGEAFHGAVIGRVAGMIGGASFHLNEWRYPLMPNHDNAHTLHGGCDFWNKRIWDAHVDEKNETVTFTLVSPDGDQGFPGRLEVSVTYSVKDGSGIGVSYEAKSDKDTPLNITNHTYFNLDGYGAGEITEHMLAIAARYFTPTNAASIPTGEIWNVADSALDFTSEKAIGHDIDSAEQQIEFAGGHDHNYILEEHYAHHPIARVRSRKSGITMDVHTDMPAIQFYSGNFLGDDPGTKGGKKAVRRGGFCLESQFFPDALHHDDFPSIILKTGDVFRSETVYKFVT